MLVTVGIWHWIHAQFLAVAEHKLIPARAGSFGRQLRKAGRRSVWAPACQDQVSDGHAGVEVISLHGAPLSAPSFFLLPSLGSYSRWLGRDFCWSVR